MKIYDVIITPEMFIKGVKAISLVENPALHNDWIALSKDQQMFELAEVDKEKHIILGIVLKPDVPIFRKGNPEDFYIRFSKETVEQAQQFFFKNGFQNYTTLEHDGNNVDGNTVFESWIVEDKDKDKTALYNLSADVGDWAIKMKINNDEVWNDYIKTGKVKGFSIEGFFKPVEIAELSEHILTAGEKVDRIKEILNS